MNIPNREQILAENRELRITIDDLKRELGRLRSRIQRRMGRDEELWPAGPVSRKLGIKRAAVVAAGESGEIPSIIVGGERLFHYPAVIKALTTPAPEEK